ncbi:hypothetical protein [Vibrio alfacsensis]|uniref:hypothetical protein n=1 Tax=Vibrio alfacsensis TaxID=1074311 RepID=UPI00406808DA
MKNDQMDDFKGKAHMLLPKTGSDNEFNFLAELETLIQRLPTVHKETREYEKSSPIADERVLVTESQIILVDDISSELADFSACLEESQLFKLDQLLSSVYKLGELKGSHNQWVVDEPYVADAEKSTNTKSITAKKNHWTSNGYQKLTGIEIAHNFYKKPENHSIQVGQLCGMIIELFKENKKPTISKEKLASFIKETLIVPPEATKQGRPPALTKQVKSTFKSDFKPYLNNDYQEKILQIFK